MKKSFWIPLAVILGLILAFAWVFRDQTDFLSKWVSGGRNKGTLNGDLADSGNPQA